MDEIINADVISGLKQIESKSVTLIVTSPPYNLRIDYATAVDDAPYRDYIKWMHKVFAECYRVLRRGGRLALNIDMTTNRQEDKDESYVRDVRTDFTNELWKIGYKSFGEHVWYKSSKDPSYNGGQFNGKKTAWGSYKSCSLPAVRRNHEYVLVFSKEQFRLERTEESGESDITAAEFQNFIASVWSIQPETRKLGHHPVPYPEELAYRCIKLYSYPNDVVLDPFSGTGTTCAVAKMTGRHFLGIDMDPDYCEYARERLAGTPIEI